MGKCFSLHAPHVPVKLDGEAKAAVQGHVKVPVRRGFPPESRYRMERRHLASGSRGMVTKVTHRATGTVYAMKSVSKKITKRNNFQREIDFMTTLDHPNIVKLREVFQDQRNVHLILEICSGGHIFDRIVDVGRFTEASAAVCVQQIVRALHHMHSNRICFRDLKPDNLMFQSEAPIERNVLKVIGFGLSRKVHADQPLRTKCGSPCFSAPEVYAGIYDEAADLWSAGVIMYVLLCGYPPFSGETPEDVLALARRGALVFPAEHWDNVSQDAKDLLGSLLKVQPQARPTANQALNHAWLLDSGLKHQVSLHGDFLNHLRCFRSVSKLKRVVLNVIASHLDEDQICELRQTFLALDSNSDGLLTVEEMRQGLGQAGFEEIPKDLQQIMQDIDSDNNGVVHYSEFVAAALDRKQYLQESVLWNAFSLFDLDGDGRVTSEELTQVLASGSFEHSFDADEIDDLLREVDDNCDGTLQFEEFVVMMRKGLTARRFDV